MSYVGSKAASGLYQAIIASMPAHDTYIETHVGSGAILKNKPPAARNIAIDLDPHTISALRDQNLEIPALEIHNDDALTFLKNFDFAAAGRTFIYLDPPYLKSSRSAPKHHNYRYEYSELDHKRLLKQIKLLDKLGIKIMISGYHSELYADSLEGWRTREIQSMSEGGIRTEVFWMNYEPTTAHWLKFAGKGFSDRQRIKRRAESWAARFKEMPADERLVILSAMLQEAS